jgi:hypothetical protein
MAEPEQPLDLSWNSGHYEALGALVHAWSTMEAALVLRIANIAQGNPRMTLCLAAQIGAANRLLDALISICREAGADETTIDQLTKAAGQLGELQRKRNRFIHNAWSSSDPSMPAMWKISADKKLTIEKVNTPNRELHDFIIKIHKFQDSVTKPIDAFLVKGELKAPLRRERNLRAHYHGIVIPLANASNKYLMPPRSSRA